ncbi:MAG: hypothetical protein IJA55_07185 [Clostridia bacterium]|nr:hypothetical protein [Clostridia bacterium]
MIKAMFKLTFILTITLFAIQLLVGCDVSTPSVIYNDSTDKEKSEVANTDIEKDEIDIDHFISDSYSESKSYTIKTLDGEVENTAVYRIPMIVANTEYAKKLNAEIYENLIEKIDKSITEIETNGFPVSCKSVSYNWSVQNDIVSLIIEIESDVSLGYPTEYLVYNISTTAEVPAENNDLIINAGLTDDEYTDKVKKILGSEFWGELEPEDTRFQDSGYVNAFNEALNKTISVSNIEEARPYINEQNELCIIAKIYSYAGPEYIWVNINTVKYNILPHCLEQAELVIVDTTVSEERAYAIARKYWNYTEEDEAEGSTVMVYDGIHERSDGNTYHVFRMRWRVGSSWSTIDYLYIDLNTGECSSYVE